jgi:hypothetical protein
MAESKSYLWLITLCKADLEENGRVFLGTPLLHAFPDQGVCFQCKSTINSIFWNAKKNCIFTTILK